ncbi:ATP-binding cassette domain-containing protein [Planococcus sp. SIMBA_143]
MSFSICEGEWVALVGDNFSGKSTIAKLMNGLLFPQQGTVKAM